ncbi:MAG: hypothetical protein GY868_19100, partial [Deltaproteobacteria bacterium]|nr:hypothetical protein [Deltaproteobacteria bacterium]
ETCPHCSQKVFELATCTRCGTAYIVGEFKRDELSGLTHLIQNSAAIGKTSYFVLDSRIAGLDEDEAVVTEDDLAASADDSIEAYTLCRQCGVIERGAGNGVGCSCHTDRQLTIYKVDPRTKTEKKKNIPPEATQLRRCVSCGSRSNNGIVFRFLTGKDAPVSVLATAFYQSLPPAGDEESAAHPG